MRKDEIFHNLGQRLCLGLPGHELDDNFIETIKRYKIGNVILFARNLDTPEQIKCLTESIEKLIIAETGIKPFIMIDEEGGIMSRLPEKLRISPTAMALGFLNDENLAYSSGYCTAYVLSSLGINFNLAPSLDVNTCKDNPVIGVRSFSSDSSIVEKIGIAVYQGQKNGGIFASVKHFPGHGGASTDSHYGLPRVDLNSDKLQLHISPFKAAIAAGVDAIMTTHIIFPSLDDSLLPATLSRKIINGYLRDELGYEGVVLSDCMEMDAIRKFYSTENGIYMAMNAGVDIALISHSSNVAKSSCEFLYEKYIHGDFNEDDFLASFNRVLSLKNSECNSSSKELFIQHRNNVLSKVNDSISIQSGSLPGFDSNSAYIGVKDFGNTNIGQFDENHPLFAETLKKKLNGKGISISSNPTEEEINNVLKYTDDCKYVYIGTFNAHLFKRQKDLLDKIVERGNAVVITLCNPYDLDENIKNKSLCTICAWDYSNRVLEYLADAIKGDVKINSQYFNF